MRARADAEVMVGARQLQLVEEHGGHLLVVVLAGVDEHVDVPSAQLATHRTGLDELRPRADNRDDLHGWASAEAVRAGSTGESPRQRATSSSTPRRAGCADRARAAVSVFRL